MEAQSSSERIEYLKKLKSTCLTFDILFLCNAFFAIPMITKISSIFLAFLCLTLAVGGYIFSAYYGSKRDRETPESYYIAANVSSGHFRSFERVDEEEVEFLYALIFEGLNEGLQWIREMVMLRDIKKIAFVFSYS